MNEKEDKINNHLDHYVSEFEASNEYQKYAREAYDLYKIYVILNSFPCPKKEEYEDLFYVKLLIHGKHYSELIEKIKNLSTEEIDKMRENLVKKYHTFDSVDKNIIKTLDIEAIKKAILHIFTLDSIINSINANKIVLEHAESLTPERIAELNTLDIDKDVSDVINNNRSSKNVTATNNGGYAYDSINAVANPSQLNDIDIDKATYISMASLINDRISLLFNKYFTERKQNKPHQR